MESKILSKGCPKCKRLEEISKEVVAEIGLDASITKVIDLDEIMDYDVAAKPGLLVNEKVVPSGRLPSKTEVNPLIPEALS